MKPSLFPTLSEVTMSNAARFTLLRTVAPVFAAALAACDAQVGDDYVGEPLALLEGTISVADSAEVPGDAIAMVVWHVWQEGDGASRTAPVAIDGEFPASFELAIYEPPPAVTQFDLGEEEASLAGVHLATGYVTVMPSADVAGDLSDVLDAALGIETEYLLVWADGGIPSGFLRFTDAIQPGYQLFRVVESPGQAEGEACLQASADCFDACFAAHCPGEMGCGAEAEACFGECPDPSLCPEYDPKATLERVPLGTALSIVVGADETIPNWY